MPGLKLPPVGDSSTNSSSSPQDTGWDKSFSSPFLPGLLLLPSPRCARQKGEARLYWIRGGERPLYSGRGNDAPAVAAATVSGLGGPKVPRRSRGWWGWDRAGKEEGEGERKERSGGEEKKERGGEDVAAAAESPRSRSSRPSLERRPGRRLPAATPPSAGPAPRPPQAPARTAARAAKEAGLARALPQCPGGSAAAPPSAEAVGPPSGGDREGSGFRAQAKPQPLRAWDCGGPLKNPWSSPPPEAEWDQHLWDGGTHLDPFLISLVNSEWLGEWDGGGGVSFSLSKRSPRIEASLFPSPSLWRGVPVTPQWRELLALPPHASRRLCAPE